MLPSIPNIDRIIALPSILEIVKSILSGTPGIVAVSGHESTGKSTTLVSMVYEALLLHDKPVSFISEEKNFESNLYQYFSIPDALTFFYTEPTYDSWSRTVDDAIKNSDTILAVEMLNKNNIQKVLEKARKDHWIFTCVDTPFWGCDVVYYLLTLYKTICPDILDNLSGVISQIIIPRLCKTCRVLSPAEIEDTRYVYPNATSPIELWKEKGCDKCNYEGTLGKIGVHEVLHVDCEVTPILKKSLEKNVQIEIPYSKYITMQDSARELVKEGRVGIDTFKRVVFRNPLFRVEYLREIERIKSVQLVQSEKMASLGELVAGIAHEINTPLDVINSNNDMIKRYVKKLEPSEKDEKLIQKIDEKLNVSTMSSESILNIVNSLRVFARLDEAEYQTAAVHELMENTLVIMKNKLKKGITIEKDYHFTEPIECFPSQLNQVFVNVINNAYDAMDGKGTLYITIDSTEGTVRVSIRDTGHGIPEDILPKIFDPGFTTKGVGVGTGLGLSICYRIIVEKHGGRIWAENNPEGGACIHIELPRKGR